jgi:hypothetical protein
MENPESRSVTKLNAFSGDPVEIWHIEAGLTGTLCFTMFLRFSVVKLKASQVLRRIKL